MRIVIGVLSFAIAAPAWAQAPAQCGPSNAAAPESALAASSLAPEFPAPAYRLGAPSGVLEHAVDEALSADRVLTRLRLEGCMLAEAAPAAAPGTSSTDPAAYKPKTAFDNTPWRFDMNQNGKRMTADEFSAWMKARGVRVARGAAPAAAAPKAEPAAPAEPQGD